MKINGVEVYGIIYKITNKINGKSYIGQTTIGFDKRYGYNLYKNTSSKHLKRSINKYGINNFNICKVFDIAFSKEELDIKEDLWINYFDSIKNGYNNMTGGSHGKHSEESRKLISKNNSKANLGKHLSQETKSKISKAKKGKQLSKKHKQKISESVKGENAYWYNKHLLEETKQKLSEVHSKKVICLTTGKIFNSEADGAKYYDVNKGNLSSCCMGSRKSAGKLEDGTKLVWSYFYAENDMRVA